LKVKQIAETPEATPTDPEATNTAGQLPYSNSMTYYKLNFRTWPTAAKEGVEIHAHRIRAYWPEPEPTLAGWFISAHDP
jgi:hypothetical protein